MTGGRQVKREVNCCDLCTQAKDEAMLLVPCGGKRKICGPCAWTVAQSLAACRVLERGYANKHDPVPIAVQQILDSR
jgi:hypothetical protein